MPWEDGFRVKTGRFCLCLRDILNIFNFVVIHSSCSCSCTLRLTIFGTLLLRRKSYKYHDKLVFVPSTLHLLLVNFTSEISYKALRRRNRNNSQLASTR